jgi:hypothetical protein
MRRASTGVVRSTWWSTAWRAVSASSTPTRWPRLHLLDGDLGPALDLRKELRTTQPIEAAHRRGLGRRLLARNLRASGESSAVPPKQASAPASAVRSDLVLSDTLVRIAGGACFPSRSDFMLGVDGPDCERSTETTGAA